MLKLIIFNLFRSGLVWVYQILFGQLLADQHFPVPVDGVLPHVEDAPIRKFQSWAVVQENCLVRRLHN